MKRPLQDPDPPPPFLWGDPGPAPATSTKPVPFWNEFTKYWSSRIWLPERTVEEKIPMDAWFSVTVHKSLDPIPPIQMPLWKIIRDPPVEVKRLKTENKVPMKVAKIRLYPTPEQRKTLLKWIGTTRWTYNECLALIKDDRKNKTQEILRAHCTNASSPLINEENPWVLDTPFDIRREGMRDLTKGITSNLAAGKTVFDMKFRSKKDPQQSIYIPSRQWGRTRGAYASILGADKLKAERPLPATLEHDSRIIRTRLGHWYLCTPVGLEIRGENQAPSTTDHCVIALDPGVRSFMTGYDPDGAILEWGKGDIGKIQRLCTHLDKLQSKWAQPTYYSKRQKELIKMDHYVRYRMKRAAARIRLRIRNLIDDCHRKLIKILVTTYRVVLIPKFETSQMVKRGHRRIRSKTARAMLTWSHYRFRMALINKAREYPWCRVIEVGEPYTTKTCTRGGHLHMKIGGNKIFKCPVCGFKIDRDWSGGRNILLRDLTVR